MTAITVPIALELTPHSRELLAALARHINPARIDDATAAPAEHQAEAPCTTEATPNLGEYWPGQGGIFVGTLPAFDGFPARHLIASTAEAELTWGGYDTETPGATSRTNGRANTAALLEHAKQGTKHPAAAWAAAYTADGHTDFHLPSQVELFMASLYAPQAFNKQGWYWSSTQNSRSNAFAQDFEFGLSLWDDEGNDWRVRAVRWIPL